MNSIARISLAPAFFIILVIGFSICAFASTDAQFDQDRKLAEKAIGHQEQQHCLKAFSARLTNVPVETAGSFRFNDFVSQQVYRTLYWKGGERGVAFTVPVRMRDPQRGEMVSNLACFYSVSNDGLVFEKAQPIDWKLFLK